MGRIIEYAGPYAALLHDYVAFRQDLGFVMPDSSQRILSAIADCLYEMPLIPEVVDLERAQVAAAQRGAESPRTRQSRYVVLRQFCIYLNRIGIKAYVPPAGAVKGRSTFVPRIVDEREMARIIATADEGGPRWPAMALRILWCTGLRIGEVSALRIGDYDQRRQSLFVAHAKYDRSRVIPIHQTLAGYLEEYIDARIVDRRPQAWLFPGKEPGSHRSKKAMGNGLRAIYSRAGVLTDADKPIRTHDLRHSFAVKALSNMAERGEDIYVALPLLSAYMGHANIFDTEYYLRLLPSEHQRIIDMESGVSETIFGGVRQ